MVARREVAAAVASQLSGYPGVDSVFCAGSTGRGHADRWSDLEIGVFWAQLPSDERR